MRAFNLILEEKLNNGDYSPIGKQEIEKRLYTAIIPDPDAIVRYGGQNRLSDLYPYQSIYSELFFIDKLFPDASREDVFKIKNQFSLIKRKFGNVI